MVGVVLHCHPAVVKEILLTGATGFVGSRLYPVFAQRGFAVRCLTRNAAKARERFPDREWMEADVADRASLRKALDGCQAAYYLVHEMGTAGDFREREAGSARAFAEAARVAGLKQKVENDQADQFVTQQNSLRDTIKQQIDTRLAELTRVQGELAGVATEENNRLAALRAEPRRDILTQTLALHALFKAGNQGGQFA